MVDTVDSPTIRSKKPKQYKGLMLTPQIENVGLSVTSPTANILNLLFSISNHFSLPFLKVVTLLGSLW